MDEEMDRLVSNVEALSLGPDDLVVITCPGPINDEMTERLRISAEMLLNGRRALVLGDGMQIITLGQHRQLQRIERSLASLAKVIGSVLQTLEDLQEREPAEARTLDGDLFSNRERDPSQPL